MPCADLAQTQSANWMEINMRTTLAALAFLASFMLDSPIHAQIVSDTPSLLIAVRHADTLA
jgi:hypothetical protein